MCVFISVDYHWAIRVQRFPLYLYMSMSRGTTSPQSLLRQVLGFIREVRFLWDVTLSLNCPVLLIWNFSPFLINKNQRWNRKMKISAWSRRCIFKIIISSIIMFHFVLQVKLPRRRNTSGSEWWLSLQRKFLCQTLNVYIHCNNRKQCQ